MPGEDLAAYERVVKRFHDDRQPKGVIETDLTPATRRKLLVPPSQNHRKQLARVFDPSQSKAYRYDRTVISEVHGEISTLDEIVSVPLSAIF